MTIEIKKADEIFSIGKGIYLLVFDPRQTNIKDLQSLLEGDMDFDICIYLLPSLDPSSIRFLKAEETVKIKGEPQ